ncbi:MAG: radical SAM protein [Bacteroidetes bacterium]|nr:radical SAM protein [Bacteroidota bacterium]
MVSGILTRKELELREAAFSIRQANFPDEIKFFVPGLKSFSIPEFKQKNPRLFLPISLTGTGCALDCDHCNKKILEPMIPLPSNAGLFEMSKKLAEGGTKSLLISGGSKKSGEVPFMKHIKDLKRIKAELGMKIIMHTGIIRDEATAAGLKDAGVDGIAMDIIGSDETIRQVYHMDATVEDFDFTLEILTKYELSLRPHIILGLHYGKFLGEYNALDMIAKYPVHALILVILTPLHDTAMFGVEPPAPEEVEEFFQNARMKLPDTNIMIGCSRPFGEYKKQVDRAAVDAGLNGIAYPAEGIVGYSKQKGLEAKFFENSCSCGC